MGTGDEHTAARRLRLLQREFTQPPRTGPVPKAEYTESARSTPAQSSSHGRSTAPLNLGIVDYIGAAVAEVVQHTRTEVPDAGPIPADAARVYDWMRQHTEHLDEARQTVREALIYRQGLEHAIAMGDITVVCPHPCPACRCYGVMWRDTEQLAVCVNVRCTDQYGMSHTWSLARLAHEHVARQKKLKANAT